MRTHYRSERLTRAALLVVILLSFSSVASADQLRLADGTLMEVDEAWEDAQGVWYKRGGVTHWVERSRVKEVLKDSAAKEPKEDKSAGEAESVRPAGGEVKKAEEAGAEQVQAVWIHFVGGAKMEVDEASESADGVWYRRGAISTFIERARIERVEREAAKPEEVAAAGPAKRRERRWTTGSARLDAIIRQNGARPRGSRPSS